MADSFTIKVVGDKRVERALALFATLAPQKSMDAVNTTALNVEKGAKERAAVKTGRMRSSIRAKTITRPNQIAEVSVNVNYGIHVEFGTHRMSAQPFLIPAYVAERPKLIKRIKEGLFLAGKEAAKVGKTLG